MPCINATVCGTERSWWGGKRCCLLQVSTCEDTIGGQKWRCLLDRAISILYVRFIAFWDKIKASYYVVFDVQSTSKKIKIRTEDLSMRTAGLQTAKLLAQGSDTKRSSFPSAARNVVGDSHSSCAV